MDRIVILERLDKMDLEAFVTIDSPHMYRMIHDYHEYVGRYGSHESADI